MFTHWIDHRLPGLDFSHLANIVDVLYDIPDGGSDDAGNALLMAAETRTAPLV